jgi:hypothetical protein
MKTLVITAVSLAALNCLAFGAAQAQQPQNRMQACAAEWRTMKAANQTEGKKYRDFQKECLARTAAAPGTAPAPATAPAAMPPAAGQPAATTRATKASGGRQAMVARERACGAEWKAAKAAGTVPAGTKWPQYWSQCNARKKAEGM